MTSKHGQIEYIKEKARIYIDILHKFQLDGKSLEIIYFLLITPLLDYSGVI